MMIIYVFLFAAIVLIVAFLFFVLILAFLVIYEFITRVPYAPVGRKIINEILNEVQYNDSDYRGKRFVDLGCGDGRVVLMAARAGFIATGYELNPALYLISRLKLALSGYPNAAIHRKDFFDADLSGADYIFFYLFPTIIPRLQDKLKKELKKGALVISIGFQVGNLILINKKVVCGHQVYFYQRQRTEI